MTKVLHGGQNHDRTFAVGLFAVGLFAVGHFAVGHFAVRTFRRTDTSP